MELKKILIANGWKEPKPSSISGNLTDSLMFNYLGCTVYFCQDTMEIRCGSVGLASDVHEAKSMADALWWFLTDCLEKTEKKLNDWHGVETDLRVMDTAAEVLSDCFAIRQAIDSIATAVFAEALN